MNQFSFPRAPPDGPLVSLYGDESYFWTLEKKGFYYVYAFVGADDETLKKLSSQMSDCKLFLRPEIDPSTWNFHASDLRNPHWLKENKVARTVEATDQAMLRLAEALSEDDERRIVSSNVWPCKHLKYLEINERKDYYIRDYVLTGTLVSLTDHVTKHGGSPSYFLESVDNSASAEFMDHYIEKIGRGLFHSLSFLYASRGKLIGLPITVRKAAAVELEYADLVAFWTSRYFSQRNKGRASEVPLEAFGKVFWGAIAPRGYGSITSIGFPWDFFYPGVR